jgi:CubicO group peptidase (beta-lactamase class C family)
LSAAFAENFLAHEELGASVAVWHRGEMLFSLGQGFQDRAERQPWTPQTRVLIWSATKGLASACLLHACSTHNIDLDQPVSSFWPEYGQAGKQSTTLLHVLSHQAGLPAMRNPAISIFEYKAVVEALANQEPFWAPGKAHGYHPRTFGFLVDELLRRISGGLGVSRYFRRVFGDPLELDLWIGMPSELADQVAPIQAPRHNQTNPAEAAFFRAYSQPHSLTRQAFSTPTGLPIPSAMNDSSFRQLSFPSLGGIGTAESLCRFYGSLCRPGIIGANMLTRIQTTVADGEDQILRIPTAFGPGFMKDPEKDNQKLRSLFGPSRSAFGQPGAGGSLAFADPENQIAFAYVMNQMEPGVLPNQKSLRLVEHLYANGLE